MNLYAQHWVAVNPLTIDGDAVSWYRHGNCAYLAWTIHITYGWPLVLLYGHPASGSPDSGTAQWFHAGVRAPDGRFVDITGPAYSDAEVAADWVEEFPYLRRAVFRECTPEEFCREVGALEWPWENEYGEVDRLVTVGFAEQVVGSVIPKP